MHAWSSEIDVLSSLVIGSSCWKRVKAVCCNTLLLFFILLFLLYSNSSNSTMNWVTNVYILWRIIAKFGTILQFHHDLIAAM